MTSTCVVLVYCFIALFSFVVDGLLETSVVFQYKSRKKINFQLEITRNFQWGKHLVKDIEASVLVSVRDYFYGVEMDMALERTVLNNECKVTVCKFCNGAKHLHKESNHSQHNNSKLIINKHITYPCPVCFGFGLTTENNNCNPYKKSQIIQKIFIPPGVYKDEVLSFVNLGNEIYENGVRVVGSLLVKVENIVGDSEDLQVHRSYVKYLVRMTPTEAMYGFNRTIANPYFNALISDDIDSQGSAVNVTVNTAENNTKDDTVNSTTANTIDSNNQTQTTTSVLSTIRLLPNNTISINRTGLYTLPETGVILENAVLFTHPTRTNTTTDTKHDTNDINSDNNNSAENDTSHNKYHASSKDNSPSMVGISNVTTVKAPQNLTIQYTLHSVQHIESLFLSRYNCSKLDTADTIVVAVPVGGGDSPDSTRVEANVVQSGSTDDIIDLDASAADTTNTVDTDINKAFTASFDHIIRVKHNVTLLCNGVYITILSDTATTPLNSSSSNDSTEDISEQQPQSDHIAVNVTTYRSEVAKKWNDLKARDIVMRRMLRFLKRKPT